MTHKPLFWILALAAIGVGTAVSVRGLAQTSAVHSFLATRSDLSVVPDSPANRRLVEAAVAGDLTAIRASFGEGASADARLRMTRGTEISETPVAILATQTEAGQESKAIPRYREIVSRVKEVDAVDTTLNRSLLMAAVDLRDLESVRMLLQGGAKLEVRTKAIGSGRTALFGSIGPKPTANADSAAILALLLDKGADPNAADAKGFTPLMQATLYGRTEIVTTLLEHGANPALREATGRTALDFATVRHETEVAALLDAQTPMDLVQAASFGKVDRLSLALKNGADPNLVNRAGVPALNLAVSSGNLEAVRYLLDHGAKPGLSDMAGFTSLHVAAQVGDAKIIRLLVDRGANPNVVAKPHGLDEPSTPLLEAVDQARPDAVVALLATTDPKAFGQLDAALRRAVATAGHIPSNPFNRRVRREEGPTLEGQDRVISLLVKAGANPRSEQSRAVYLAAENGQPGLLEMMLAHGGSPDGRASATDSVAYGATALIGAVDTIAMSQGVVDEVKKGTLYTSDSPQNLHSAVKGSQKVFDLLLKHRANPNLADGRGETALIHCVTMECPELIAPLVSAGAKVDLRNREGKTALMFAAGQGNLTLVQKLIRFGANVNLADRSGRTPLMLAVDDGENERARETAREMDGGRVLRQQDLPNSEGHPAVVRFLLAHRAKRDARAADGSTASSLAKKERFTAVQKMLGSQGEKG